MVNSFSAKVTSILCTCFQHYSPFSPTLSLFMKLHLLSFLLSKLLHFLPLFFWYSFFISHPLSMPDVTTPSFFPCPSSVKVFLYTSMSFQNNSFILHTPLSEPLSELSYSQLQSLHFSSSPYLVLDIFIVLFNLSLASMVIRVHNRTSLTHRFMLWTCKNELWKSHVSRYTYCCVSHFLYKTSDFSFSFFIYFYCFMFYGIVLTVVSILCSLPPLT